MNKRKLIRKTALIATIVLVISIVILILQFPYHNWKYDKQMKLLDKHIKTLTAISENMLSETAKKITAIPVDPRVTSEVQSKFLKDEQKIRQYMWMIDRNGEFVFGVPQTVFARLNNAYDKYNNVIKNDGYYVNRNDFLAKLIARHEDIDFSQFKAGSPPTRVRYNWRFFKPSLNTWFYTTSMYFKFSSPVTNEAGEYLGELYLKVDDSKNSRMYCSKNQLQRHDLYSVLNPIFGVLAILSGFILWFLLPTWVYIDAQQRDVKNPGLWAFFTLISAIFGLIIYLITRPQTMKSLNCPQCDKELNGTKTYCPYCGFDVSSTFCPQCQYPVQPDWLFCPSCRAELSKVIPGEEDAEKGA